MAKKSAAKRADVLRKSIKRLETEIAAYRGQIEYAEVIQRSHPERERACASTIRKAQSQIDGRSRLIDKKRKQLAKLTG